MVLLNYTTQVKEEDTIAKIEKMLAEAHVSRILKDYDKDGHIEAIDFIIDTDMGKLPIKMPLQLKEVYQTLQEQSGEYKRTKSGQCRMVPQSLVSMDQARKVGWRIIKDWLEANLAVIKLRQVKIQQVFLPYIVGNDGKTLYEKFEESRFKGYLLDGNKEE